MREYILLAEGSSDKVLLRIIDWILGSDWCGSLADFARLPKPPKSLREKLEILPQFYGCPEFVFYHKDADAMGLHAKREQLEIELNECKQLLKTTFIKVVPERMTEAWFLFDEQAIRVAAQNPRSKVDLNIREEWDKISDPKSVLFGAIKSASGRSGRDLNRLKPNVLLHQLAEDITDYAPLRKLEAFRVLEADIRKALEAVD